MSIKSDNWIRRMAQDHDMVSPFEPDQVKTTARNNKIISYGTSSYGYDVRCSDEFKIFHNINSAVVDPKRFDRKSFVDVKSDVCIIPPNSFCLARTVEYEIARQIEVLENGGRVIQQTLGWSEDRGATYVQRSKEYAEDYRYFPEPDLPPLEISREWVAQLRAQLPELPDAKRARFVTDYGLSDYDAGILVADKSVANYYEAATAAASGVSDPKTVANWVTGELFRLMKETAKEIGAVQVTPQALVELVGLVEDNTINTNTGKDVLAEMFASGRSAHQIVDERGLAQISDTAALEKVVAQVLEENPQQVSQYLGGKVQLLGWMMGQVMRATRGKANPQVVRSLLKEQLERMRNT